MQLFDADLKRMRGFYSQYQTEENANRGVERSKIWSHSSRIFKFKAFSMLNCGIFFGTTPQICFVILELLPLVENILITTLLSPHTSSTAPKKEILIGCVNLVPHVTNRKLFSFQIQRIKSGC